MTNVFLVDVFIICFRESLEAAVVISVLLAFVKQSFGGPAHDPKAYKRLLWHIWLGSALGIFICLIIGGAFIGAFYSLGQNEWSKSEDLWEGILALIAAIMITAMGIGMLRVNKMQEKWRVKISQAILEGTDEEDPKYKGRWGWVQRINPKNFNPLNFRFKKLAAFTRKYALFLLPFITTLREGVEAVVFVGGVGLGKPAESFPLPVIVGLVCGFLVGFILYKCGNRMSIKWFLIFSTCFLYLIASGLFSRSVWFFEMNEFSKKTGGDVAENGAGPGSYNIKNTVWHVNCCNPEMNDNGWGIFNALFGWQNTATYGSVISYNVYWIFIMVLIASLMYEEKTGQFPLVGRWWKRKVYTQEEMDELYRRAQKTAQERMEGPHRRVPDEESKIGFEKKNGATVSEKSVSTNEYGKSGSVGASDTSGLPGKGLKVSQLAESVTREVRPSRSHHFGVLSIFGRGHKHENTDIDNSSDLEIQELPSDSRSLDYENRHDNSMEPDVVYPKMI